MWYLYIVKCSDGSFYTGITLDPERRVFEHNNDDKKGAKSLRGKRPVELVYLESYHNQIEAAKRENAIKNWKRENKLKLILNSGTLKEKGFTLKNLAKFFRADSSTGRASRS